MCCFERLKCKALSVFLAAVEQVFIGLKPNGSEPQTNFDPHTKRELCCEHLNNIGTFQQEHENVVVNCIYTVKQSKSFSKNL